VIQLGLSVGPDRIPRVSERDNQGTSSHASTLKTGGREHFPEIQTSAAGRRYFPLNPSSKFIRLRTFEMFGRRNCTDIPATVPSDAGIAGAGV
jgi:hypothetical protein